MTYRQIYNKLTDNITLDKNKDKTNQSLQQLFGQMNSEEKKIMIIHLLRAAFDEMLHEERNKTLEQNIK